MGKRTVKILASKKDSEALQPILDALQNRDAKPLKNVRTLKKKELLLVALSDNFYADRDLCRILMAQVASGAENIMLIKLDDSSIPEALKTATYARNVISTTDRDSTEIAERIISAFPKKKSLWWLFVAVALMIVAASGVFLHHKRVEAEAAAAAAAEAARIEAERIAEEQAIAELEAKLPKGITADDLAKIESVTIIGNSFTFQTAADYAKTGSWNDIYTGGTAYRVCQEDGGHWISTEDGSEFVMTRYEDLEFISMMPKLRTLSMASVDCDALPDLRAMLQLDSISISDCNIDNLDWLAASSLKSFDIHNTQVTDYSPLSQCDNLIYAQIDLAHMKEADFSGFAPRKLMNLTVVNGTDTGLLDFSGLAQCLNLNAVYFEHVDFRDLSFLKDHTNLKNLEINYSDHLQDISGLSSLKEMTSLTIRGCESVRDYSPVGECTDLQRLNLENNEWENYYLTDASFLSNLPRLTDAGLYGFPLKDLDFLKDMANNSQKISFGFAGDIQDYSGLSAVKSFSFLHVNPRGYGGPHGDYALVAPYLQGASVDHLQLHNCTNVDLSILPKITRRLEIFGGTLNDLSGLQENYFTEIRLDSCQYLKSLQGIEAMKLLPTVSYSVCAEIVNCPRLTDFSALSGAKLNRMELTAQYELPDFGTFSVDRLRLDSIYELKDLSCLDALDNIRNRTFELAGLEEVNDLTPLQRFHGNSISVPPHLAEQAQELVDNGNFRRYEIIYPDGDWQNDNSEIQLLSLEELDTLPKALLKRVGRLAIAGDMLIEWDQYDTDENWDNSEMNNGFPYVSLVNRSTGEHSALNKGIVENFSMFSALTGLRELQLTAEPLESLDGVQNLENLRFLEVRNSNDLRDISAAFALPELEWLKVRCSLVDSIQGIQNLRHLNCLDIFHTQVKDLSPLTECDFSEAYANEGGFELECDALPCTDFSPLAAIKEYKRLCLNNIDSHLWVEPLANSKIYSFCSCGANWDTETITAFVNGHPEMEEFDLSWNSNVTDISFLSARENLKTVRVTYDMTAAIESLKGLEYSFELQVQG